MKQFSNAIRIICMLAVMCLMIDTVQAQPRFSVKLRISDGVVTDSMYFGVAPGKNFCILQTDSINGILEDFLPPAPPSGVFDTRFVWPRAGSNAVCFDQGSKNDFRPYTAPAQRDTFRVKAQLGDGTTMTFTWQANLASRFTQATLRYFDQTAGQNVNVDMLTNTTANVTEAGDPATVNIYTFSPLTSVEPTSTGVPQQFALGQNYPNPFNPTTNIEFSVVQAAMTDISVYDILGRKVATLAAEMLTPGFYKVAWDGKNTIGNNVASGVYFVRMNAQAENGVNFSAMRKLLLMK